LPGVFFSASQVWQIVTYVRTLSKTGSFQAPAGDPGKGKALFASKGCGGCHLVNGTGATNGPELSFIGSQRPVDFLKKSLQFPNDTVDQAFWTASATLENGTTHRGFVMNEDTYNVQLLTSAKGLLTLQRKDLRKYEVNKNSAMPAFRGTESELTDLVAYLWTLQRPRSEQ